MSTDNLKQDVTTKVRAMIADQLNVDSDKIISTATLDDFQCDLLDAVELVMEIEEVFSIFVSDQEINDMAPRFGDITVQQIIDHVASKCDD